MFEQHRKRIASAAEQTLNIIMFTDGVRGSFEFCNPLLEGIIIWVLNTVNQGENTEIG